MTIWLAALWALIPALAVPLTLALSGTVALRIVAFQLASALAITVLMVMSFAYDQTSYLSLAEALAVMNVAGTLVMAVTVERWL